MAQLRTAVGLTVVFAGLVQVDLTPEKLTPAKRLKPGDDNDEGEDEVEGEQVLDYTTVQAAPRLCRSCAAADP